MHSYLGFSLLHLESRRALPGLQPLPIDLHSDSSCIPGLCLQGWATRGDSCSYRSFSFSSPQIWHPTNKPSPMTSSCISRWMPLSPTEGNLQPLLSSPSLWCPYFIKALWALKPHFTEFAPHPRLLCHRTSHVHSDLRAEKECLSCPRSHKLPAAWESMSTTQLRLTTSLLLHIV